MTLDEWIDLLRLRGEQKRILWCGEGSQLATDLERIRDQLQTYRKTSPTPTEQDPG